jgi:hypothetical protein
MISLITKLNPSTLKQETFKAKELFNFILLLAFVYFITDPISTFFGDTSHTKTFGDFDLIGIFSALMFAPVIEEVTFRMHLSGQKKHAWGVLLMLVTFTLFMKLGWALVALLLFGGFIFIYYDEFAEFISVRYYNPVFYITAFLFSLAHINNIDSHILLHYKIIIILTYLPIGIYFGYIRKKYGLVMAILAHSFYNLSVLTLNGLCDFNFS